MLVKPLQLTQKILLCLVSLFFLGQIGAITMDVLVSKLSNAACFERTGLMGIR